MTKRLFNNTFAGKESLLFFLRKALLLSAVLLLGRSAGAEVIPQREAASIARTFFEGNALTRATSTDVNLVWTGPTLTRSSFSPYYVYNCKGGGWVVISGDDRVRPVLAYSTEGSFETDDMPDNVLGWYSGLADYMSEVNSSENSQAKDVAREWALVKSGTKTGFTVIRKLSTAKWGQGTRANPTFNKMCPKINDSCCVTGCAQTSLAIVMRYFKWPKTGSGLTIPSYTCSNVDDPTVGPVTLDHTYDWDNMPVSKPTSSAYTSEVYDKIGTLMYELGVMNMASYGRNGTGADFAYDRFVEYFDYDPLVRNCFRNGYSDEQWYDMIRYNIDNVGPVIYIGYNSSTTSGHQFILDGYATNDYFSFNWGWSGSGWDGYYFLLSDITLGSSDFTYFQEAYFNIKPGSGSSTVSEAPIWISQYRSSSYKGMYITGGSYADGKTLSFSCRWLMNRHSTPFVGNIRAAVINYAGSVKTQFGAKSYTGLECRGARSLSYSYSVKSPRLGDRVIYQYKLSDDTAYKRVYAVAGEPIKDEIAAFDYPFIEVDPSGYKAGDHFYYRISNTNRLFTVQWFFDGVERSTSDITLVRGGAETLTSGEHTIKAVVTFEDGSIKRLTVKIDVE